MLVQWLSYLTVDQKNTGSNPVHTAKVINMKREYNFNDLTNEQLALLFKVSQKLEVSGDVLLNYIDKLEYLNSELLTEDDLAKLYLEEISFNYNKMQYLLDKKI